MRQATDVCTAYADVCGKPGRDAALAELAERQHGVVATYQLEPLGLGRSAVSGRAASGRLHRVHRGVYAVGYRRLTQRGRWMAAVLACGPEAVLSHRDAAALLGLRPDTRRKVDISVPSAARSRAGIDVHVSGTLCELDVTACEGIPCTTVARTLLDLGDVVDRRGVERAVEQAEILRLFDLGEVEEVIGRAGPRRGAGVLRAVIDDWVGQGLTASELEERFLNLCRRARLPQPAVNAWLPLAGEEVKADFVWRTERLVVETDGRASHGTRQAFESDRLRDQRLAVAGYRIVRFTWRQVAEEPDTVAATVGELLGR
jgi:very-short-patch-repair endonuclease